MAEEYYRRLTEESMRFYKPHGQQLPFHSSPAEIRLLSGSNQCGKSRALRHEVQVTVGKVHPWRKNYSGIVYARHCCADFQVMQAVVIPGYKEELPRKPCELDWKTYEGKPAYWPGLRGGKWETAWSAEARTIFLADGSLIEFKSYDQDQLSYAGPPRHLIANDEEPPIHLRKENQARQATVGINEIFAFTPLNYSQWLYDLFEQAQSNPRIAAFKMSMYDNPLIKPEVIEAFEKDYADDPAELAARLYGEFTFSAGRVWKGYGAHNLVEPFVIPADWDRIVVIDPHLEKATGVNAFAVSDTGYSYCYYENDIKGDVEQICSQIKSDLGGQRIETWLIDPSSRQSTGIHGKGRLIDEFRKYIPYLIEANNDHQLGIAAVARIVKENPTGGPLFRVFASCTTTDYQMRNYSFKPPLKTGENRNKPEVVKRNDEHCDCVRYFAMYNRITSHGEQFKGFEVKPYAN